MIWVWDKFGVLYTLRWVVEVHCNSGFLELWILGLTEAPAKAMCWNYFPENWDSGQSNWDQYKLCGSLWEPPQHIERKLREKEARLELVLFQMMEVTFKLKGYKADWIQYLKFFKIWFIDQSSSWKTFVSRLWLSFLLSKGH